MCALSLLLATTPMAQAGLSAREKPYALIFGTVWGPDNRPVFGVKVHIRRSGDKKARWELVSDHNGEFAQRVPAGTADYVVSAATKKPEAKSKSHSSLQTNSAHSEVTVHVQNDERIDVGLHLIEQELPRK